jgi:hypothetical protein
MVGAEGEALGARNAGTGADGPSRLIKDYFFVAFPSITVIQFVPSCDISNFMV